MEYIELSWIRGESSLKEALKKTLGSSGQLIKKYYSSKEQDRPIRPKDLSRIPLALANHMKINPSYEGPEIQILSESEDFIVVHKPPGIHCHPHSYEDKNTLLNFLAVSHKWASLLVNENLYDRGLLYRLDFETSGVVALAKTEKAFNFIRKNFSSEVRRKFYWAVVEGEFDKEGRWVHFFKSTGHKGVKQKVSEEEVPDAQEGTLSVLRVSSTQGKSLLLVNLKTGLRHQIRAQLAFLGFPILGDELYGGRKADRLFLHALRYEIMEVYEDSHAELFNVFFDLNGTLQMSHDMLRRF